MKFNKLLAILISIVLIMSLMPTFSTTLANNGDPTVRTVFSVRNEAGIFVPADSAVIGQHFSVQIRIYNVETLANVSLPVRYDPSRAALLDRDGNRFGIGTNANNVVEPLDNGGNDRLILFNNSGGQNSVNAFPYFNTTTGFMRMSLLGQNVHHPVNISPNGETILTIYFEALETTTAGSFFEHFFATEANAPIIGGVPSIHHHDRNSTNGFSFRKRVMEPDGTHSSPLHVIPASNINLGQFRIVEDISTPPDDVLVIRNLDGSAMVIITLDSDVDPDGVIIKLFGTDGEQIGVDAIANEDGYVVFFIPATDVPADGVFRATATEPNKAESEETEGIEANAEWIIESLVNPNPIPVPFGTPEVDVRAMLSPTINGRIGLLVRDINTNAELGVFLPTNLAVSSATFDVDGEWANTDFNSEVAAIYNFIGTPSLVGINGRTITNPRNLTATQQVIVLPDENGTSHTFIFVVEGSIVSQQLVILGSEVSEPIEPAREGFTFTGWFDANTGEEFTNFDTPLTVLPTGVATVLVAGWDPIVTQPGPFTISGSLIGLSAEVVDGLVVTFTIDGVEGSYTVGADGRFEINDIPYGADVVITPPAQSGFTVNPSNWTFENVTSNEINRNFHYTPIDTADGPFTITVRLQGSAANIANRPITYYIAGVAQPTRNTGTNGELTIANIPHNARVEFSPPAAMSNYRRVGGDFDQVITRNWTVNFEYYRPSVITQNVGGGGGGGTPTSTLTVNMVDEHGNIIFSQTITQVQVGSTQRVYAPDDLEGFELDDDAVRTITITNNAAQNVVTFRYREIDGGVWFYPDNHFRYLFGFPDGTIRPDTQILREEVATIFFRLLTTDVRNRFRTNSQSFPDVDSDRWSNQAIATMARAGILQGDLNTRTFRPGEPITRAEFATIAMRFDNMGLSYSHNFSDIAGHWAEHHIAAAADRGWILGYPDGTFRPDQLITRAEAATLINRVLGRSVDQYGIDSSLIINFPDLPLEHWAYYQIMEATISHTFVRRYDDERIIENWTGPGEDINFGELLWIYDSETGTYLPDGNI